MNQAKYTSKQLVFFSSWAGLATGVVSFIWFLAVHKMGANAFYSFPQKLSILIQAVAAFAAIYLFRKNIGRGTLTFGEGILVGLLVSVVTAWVSSLLMYVYTTYLEPQMVAEHVNSLRQYLLKNKSELIERSSQAMYEGNLKATEQVSAFTLAVDEFIWKIIRGLMFSILVSLVLRRSVGS